jgi:hypothetical protein
MQQKRAACAYFLQRRTEKCGGQKINKLSLLERRKLPRDAGGVREHLIRSIRLHIRERATTLIFSG